MQQQLQKRRESDGRCTSSGTLTRTAVATKQAVASAAALKAVFPWFSARKVGSRLKWFPRSILPRGRRWR